jgi:hypothetical protein
MVHDLFCSALLLMRIWWISVILIWLWPPHQAAPDHTDRQPAHRAPRRRQDPKPFAGLTHKPCCVACEHAVQASAVQSVVYPIAADNVSGPLASRLIGVNQPVIRTPNGFLRSHLTLLPCI